MGRMLELIRTGAAPPSVMRSAARGALSVTAHEMVEILVLMANETEYADEAQETLARWDERSLQVVLRDPGTPDDVLRYFTDFDHFRESLLSVMLENRSITDDMMVRLASRAPVKVLSTMLRHGRVLTSSAMLSAIKLNLNLSSDDQIIIEAALAKMGAQDLLTPKDESADSDGTVVDYDLDAALDEMIALYEREHAAEIAAEEGKPFQLVMERSAQESTAEPAALVGEAAEETAEQVEEPKPETVEQEPVAAAAAPKVGESDEDAALRKESSYQKIASMSVGERVQLAMKGKKEERMILIRDGARVVSTAVLESPKLTEQEVETFATMKNVSDIVLRVIASKRKFMRNYTVHKNLASNPRLPLDLGLTLIKGLMIGDLKAMTTNKNISDVLRKVAIKLYRQRSGHQ